MAEMAAKCDALATENSQFRKLVERRADVRDFTQQTLRLGEAPSPETWDRLQRYEALRTYCQRLETVSNELRSQVQFHISKDLGMVAEIARLTSTLERVQSEQQQQQCVFTAVALERDALKVQVCSMEDLFRVHDATRMSLEASCKEAHAMNRLLASDLDLAERRRTPQDSSSVASSRPSHQQIRAPLDPLWAPSGPPLETLSHPLNTAQTPTPPADMQAPRQHPAATAVPSHFHERSAPSAPLLFQLSPQQPPGLQAPHSQSHSQRAQAIDLLRNPYGPQTVTDSPASGLVTLDPQTVLFQEVGFHRVPLQQQPPAQETRQLNSDNNDEGTRVQPGHLPPLISVPAEAPAEVCTASAGNSNTPSGFDREDNKELHEVP